VHRLVVSRDDVDIGLTYTRSASVKEACVLAMLRLANECEEVPEEVIERIKKMAEIAGKFLRRVWWSFVVADTLSLMYPAFQRYDQFLFSIENRDFLRKIVSTAKSSSVGDVLVASNELLTYPYSSLILLSPSKSTTDGPKNQPLNLRCNLRRLRHPR